MIFERKCAYGDCEHCGIGKFFTAHKCPLEWDDTMELKIKEYQDMERNNSDWKQKELVLVTGYRYGSDGEDFKGGGSYYETFMGIMVGFSSKEI